MIFVVICKKIVCRFVRTSTAGQLSGLKSKMQVVTCVPQSALKMGLCEKTDDFLGMFSSL